MQNSVKPFQIGKKVIEAISQFIIEVHDIPVKPFKIRKVRKGAKRILSEMSEAFLGTALAFFFFFGVYSYFLYVL